MTVALNTIVSAVVSHIEASVQGETVLLQYSSGQYYGLNVVGAEVWKLIQSPTTVGAVVEDLLGQFEVDRLTLVDDVGRLIEDLEKFGLATTR